MQRIGVFDSGIGGLTTLAEIAKTLGGGDFVYYADNLSAPFGSKETSELLQIGENAIKVLSCYGCETVVLACNTLTATVKSELVDKFGGIRIIGTEPAVLPAVRENLRVALLATPASISSRRVQELLLECRGQVTCFPMSNLAGIIEEIAPDWTIMYNYLKQTCSYLKNYDAVVLGCTHFVHVKHVFCECFPGIKVYDGNEGVARRVKSFINYPISGEKIKIYTAKKDEEQRYYKIFKKFYKNLKMGIEK